MKLPFLLNSVSQCNSLKQVEGVFVKLLKALPSLDGNTVSHCLNILSKKEINQPKLYWNRTAKLLTQKCSEAVNCKTVLSNYEVKHVCIILNSFAKVGHLSLNLIEESTNIIVKQIRDVHTRDICNVIHSLGKLNQISPLTKIINKLFGLSSGENNFEKILDVIERCNEQDFSMILRVFLLNSQDLEFDAVTQNLLKSISDKYDNLSDQTLAILSNSLANYGRDDNQTLSVLAPIITFRLRKGYFTQQCVAQIANGYAKLNRRDMELFTAISDRVLDQITQFSVRCLSNVLNAFSKLSIFKRDLFMVSIVQLERNVDSMTPQCIGNVVNSYSKFVKKIELPILISFFNTLITAMLTLNDFDSFIGQNYANILNGMSKVHMISHSSGNLKEPNVDLEEAVGSGLEHVSSCDASMSDVNKSFRTKAEELNLFELFKKLSNPIINIMDDLNHLDVLLITNSMSRCRVVDDLLLSRLLMKLKRFHKKYKTLEVVNVINTLSILYQCLVNQNYKSIYNKGTSLIYSRILQMDRSSELSIKDQIMSHYLYFIGYFFGNLELFKNLRPLDIKLLFNSFGRCNIDKKEYCDTLVDKIISFGENGTVDMIPVVNYYRNCNKEVPIRLKEYINRDCGDKSDQTLVCD